MTTGKDGADRLALESRTYFARYRDGDGIVVECSTECHDEGAARAVLADLERRAERVKAGLLTPNEDRVAGHRASPIVEHFAAYLEHMRAAGSVPMHRDNTHRFLKRIASDCGFAILSNLSRDSVEHWLAHRAEEGMSARSRNAYRTAIVSFGNWAVSTHRLTVNPFKGLPG